jgi:hypothetical protein
MPSSNKKRTTQSYKDKRALHFCREHGPNTTHDSKDCKVLSRKSKDWKKKDTFEKSEYKKKTRELNLLQKETRKEKAKWTKAYNKLNKSTKSNPNNDMSDGEVSKCSDPVCSKRDTDDSDSSSSSSNSSSSSDTDSN